MQVVPLRGPAVVALLAAIIAAALALFVVLGGQADAAKPVPQPPEGDFEKIPLADAEGVGEPMSLAVLPDGRVLHTSRTGEVRMWDPQTEASRVINTLNVYQHDEEGLQSVAIDSNFADNNWVYLYYSPPQSTPPGDAPDEGTAADFAAFEGDIYLSRFKLVGDSLDLSTEQVILQVPVDRGICCHVGGDIDFDNNGNLYLSTGDDTNPFASDGYAPLDERPNRNPAYDAQRTSANTNDLRGKLLRIHPEADGSYTIPAGNLFAPGTAQTRPEIYAMGLRNPFRFSVDPATGWAYLGDYSPDAQQADPNRGPAGQGEWQVIKSAGNYGWPYCGGPNLAYNDYDFATQTSGPAFDCANGPTNNSPNNTGLTQLPPAQEPDVHYSYSPSQEFPELETGGIGPMGGPVYHYDQNLQSPNKFPQYYDRSAFFYEWTRDYIKEFRLDSSSRVTAINDFMPSTVFENPMDMEFGPDGTLYVLEYGEGYFAVNPEAQLSRIEYVQGNKSPAVGASATPTSGQAPLTVQFTSEGQDPEGGPVTYAWDFDDDGTVDSTDPNATYTYNQVGNYNAQLTVSDSTGRTRVANIAITVGNTAPELSIELPPDGGFFEFGDRVPFRVTVDDPEDGADGVIDCSRVEVNYVLGHDQHGHPITSTTGCEGVLQTVVDNGHDENTNIFGVVAVTYEDEGGQTGAAQLSDQAEAILQPKHKQAEFFSSTGGRYGGVQVQPSADVGGGNDVAGIQNGDWVSYEPMSLQGIDSVTYRVSGNVGGTIEVRADSPTGQLLSTATVGRGKGYRNVQASVTDPGGSHELFFVFNNASAGKRSLFNLNYMDFNGQGVAEGGP